MATALRQQEPVTIETFDAYVATQSDPRLFELAEGVIVVMSNPTEIHEEIVGNIAVPLKTARLADERRDFMATLLGGAYTLAGIVLVNRALKVARTRATLALT